MLRILLIAAFVAFTSAACPNQCSGEFYNENIIVKLNFAAGFPNVLFQSYPPHPPLPPGHGWCDENERCVCFRAPGTANQNAAYTGADCSQRVCPYGRSHDIVSIPHFDDPVANAQRYQC